VSSRVLAGLAAICLTAALAPAAVDDPPSEYEVKGAFLFHFARLTEWPAAAMPEGEPFVIAILGQDPFGTALDRMLESQTAHGRPLQVHRSATVADLPERPHIVFIGSSEQPSLAAILSRFKGQPVLTVGEMDGFGEKGGIVNFVVTAEGRVRFEVNVREADASGLKLSSQVLKLARIVGLPP
jgi:uncharacterized protein DUF4154